MIRAPSGLTRVLICVLLGAIAAPVHAQQRTTRSPKGLSGIGQPDTEQPLPPGASGAYVPPRFKFQQKAIRPLGTHLGEARVDLSCMVDVTGKPHDVAVTQSYGEKAFETAAKDSLERSTFEPATLNGKPVEARFTLSLEFWDSPDVARHNSSGASLPDVSRGESSEFTAAYSQFQKALKANDRTGADRALAQMHISNHYGAATYGLAQYQYAVLWGTQPQQLEAIRRAVFPDNQAQDFSYSEQKLVGGGSEIFNRPFQHYLPVDVWKTALLTCLDLELKQHEYSEALATWQRLQKAGIKPEILDKLKPVMEQLNALRTDSRAFDVSGVLSDNGWSLGLFKSNFRIVASGSIDQISLRCDSGYLSFKFDPEQEYKVNGNYGNCDIQLTGTPGTQFTMTQF